MARYVIWNGGDFVSDRCMNNEQEISDWVYAKIEAMTHDSDAAIEASSWAEFAAIRDEYSVDGYAIKITIEEDGNIDKKNYFIYHS